MRVEAPCQRQKQSDKKARERDTCVEKCLQLCGDVAPPGFNLTTAVGQVSPRSVKIVVYLKILNV